MNNVPDVINPVKNFIPRSNPAHIPVGSLPIPAEPLDLSTLTDDDLRRDCRESLVMMIRNCKGDLKALGAVRELLDRLEGKPVQRQAIVSDNKIVIEIVQFT